MPKASQQGLIKGMFPNSIFKSIKNSIRLRTWLQTCKEKNQQDWKISPKCDQMQKIQKCKKYKNEKNTKMQKIQKCNEMQKWKAVKL